MANSFDDLIEHYELFEGALKKTPQQLVADYLETLDRIVAALKGSPLAPNIRIFGSAILSDRLIPGDIDAFVEGPYELPARDREAAFGDLLELCANEYGWFDVFRYVRPKDRRAYLAVRSAEPGVMGWDRASNRTSKAIMTAGRAGVPVADFSRSFTSEFAAEMAAVSEGIQPDQPQTAGASRR